MMDLLKRVEQDIGTQGLIAPGDTVLMGVSGGADSVCLFHILYRLYHEGGVSLYVMHVHHHLRAEADAEALYAEALCRRYGVPYRQADVHVEKYLAESGISSTEEAARNLRYEALTAYLAELPGTEAAKKLAVAHTLNDNAETVLHHLFRGTGLRGLGGIQAGRGQIIRPLLSVSRAEVEAFLTAQGIGWCTDSSNEGDDYARNRIRHHILPMAEQEVNAQAAEHIHAAARQLSAAEDYIFAQVREAYGHLVSAQEDGVRIARKEFMALHPYLQERLALYCMQQVCGSARDITAKHVRIFLGLFAMPAGKMLDLPHRLFAKRQREYIELLRKN